LPLWGNANTAAASYKLGTEMTDGQCQGSGNAAKAANNTALFANVTVGAFVPGKEVGQWPVTVQEMANTAGERKDVTHAGWNMRHAWTGPVATVGFSVGGTGYANTDTIKVSGGTTNATGSISTNSTGGIVSVALTGGGSGFINVSSTTIAAINSTGGASAGSGATLTFTLGGRAGRVFYENLVAFGSITSSGNSIPAT
jgi:hypothetical protein